MSQIDSQSFQPIANNPSANGSWYAMGNAIYDEHLDSTMFELFGDMAEHGGTPLQELCFHIWGDGVISKLDWLNDKGERNCLPP